MTTSTVISTVGAPSGITAVAGNSQVTLNWTPVAGASTYHVYYATAPGISITGPITAGPVVVTPVAGNAVVVKVITGLTNGTPYYFVVTAVTSTGESVLSGEVSAVPNVHVITTIAGKVMTTGSTDGAGLTAALFDNPAGIAT
ncbi:MAG: fibronectin type III domain-containing protein, partial [Nitrospinae bacterium]|nr:fibronectin type III domain-containing protein [Nitrospinota bacterium]